MLILIETMSSQLTSLIPMLDGSNYTEWSKKMRAYLQSQGVWRYTNGNIPRISFANADQPTPAERKANVKWFSEDDKANGAIQLRVAPSLSEHFGNTSQATWNNLKTACGTPGAAAIFGDFRSAITLRISGLKHPLPEI